MPALVVGALKQASHTDYLFVFLPDGDQLPGQSAHVAALVEDDFGSPDPQVLGIYELGSITGP